MQDERQAHVETTEVVEVEVQRNALDTMVDQAIAQFPMRDIQILELVERFKGLEIADVDDNEGYDEVHEALQVMVKVRTGIDAKRRELNEDAVEYKRRVDAEAKRLTNLGAQTELELKAERDRVRAERREVIRRGVEERRKKLSDRMQALGQAGAVLLLAEVEAMTDEVFETALKEAQDAQARAQAAEIEERDRLAEEKRAADAKLAQEREERRSREAAEAVKRAEEEAKRQAKLQEERERLDKEREELARERAELAKERAEKEKKAEAKRKREAKKREEKTRKALEAARPAVVEYLGLVNAIELPECPFKEDVDGLRADFVAAVLGFLPEEVSQ